MSQEPVPHTHSAPPSNGWRTVAILLVILLACILLGGCGVAIRLYAPNLLQGFSLDGIVPAAPEATEAPAAQEPDGPDVCGQQGDKLPEWATNDQPEDFTVDSRGGVTHLTLWKPGKSPADTEYSIILKDVKVNVFQAGGTGWQWIGCMDVEAARADAIAHGLRRTDAGKQTVQISVEDFNEMYPDSIQVVP